MAKDHRRSWLQRRRKRAKTLKRLQVRYEKARREERTLLVEKLRRVAPWLGEDHLQAKARPK
jgi:uncharacterized protein DUF6800